MPTTNSHTFFFFNDTATTEIYTLSLHDALPTPRCHPSLATLMASLPAPSHAIPRARARNASARAFPSLLPPAAPPAVAAHAPPRRSTDQSRAPQIIRMSPPSKLDSRADRTPACPGTFRTPPAFPAESPLHQKRILPP